MPLLNSKTGSFSFIRKEGILSISESRPTHRNDLFSTMFCITVNNPFLSGLYITFFQTLGIFSHLKLIDDLQNIAIEYIRKVVHGEVYPVIGHPS